MFDGGLQETLSESGLDGTEATASDVTSPGSANHRHDGITKLISQIETYMHNSMEDIHPSSLRCLSAYGRAFKTMGRDPNLGRAGYKFGSWAFP